MDYFEILSVFDVADDRREFREYLAYLHAEGVRPTRDVWLSEAAERLLGPESPDVRPPTRLDQGWTLERRRLLVVLTWPYAHGERSPKFPVPYDSNDQDSGISGIYGRTYREMWADVRTNLESLAFMAKWRGSWEALAKQWGLSGDILDETARLGLIKTHLGQSVSEGTVSSLRADVHERAAHARKGLVLTSWDIVAVGESVGFSFEPVNSDHKASGKYFWDREELVRRISEAAHIDRVRSGMLAQVEADIEAMFSPEFAPSELHCRITADGRIVPPRMGSKYRAMFERLDAEQSTVRISREELDELTSRAEFEVTRVVRGARGKAGLPNSALRSAQWWYGPWNPDERNREVNGPAMVDSSWSEAMGKKSQTRAWMAAGFRAKPIFNQRTLTAVQFEPTMDRQYWWPWRDELRDGSFSVRVAGGAGRARGR